MCHSSPESVRRLGVAYVGGCGREFLERVGNSARVRRGGGLCKAGHKDVNSFTVTVDS